VSTKHSESPPHFPPILESVRDCVKKIPTHLVGGAVRDLLLNRDVNDFDFVVPQKSLEISRSVADKLGGAFYPLDKERETGRVILVDAVGKRLHLDFAIYRGANLESDLRSRDFTINAMAIDVHRPEGIIDPLGGGVDLHRRQLKTCTPTSLDDDPVRILRAIRFATDYQMRIQPETLQTMRRLVDKLGQVSIERLRDELFRILGNNQPVTCLRVLDQIGGLRVILPELEPMRGLAQPPPHYLDAWGHTLDVMTQLGQVLAVLSEPYNEESASNLYTGLIALRLGRYRQRISELLRSELSEGRTLRSILVFAALYHDAGKPAALQTDESARIRFFDHDKIGGDIVSHRAKAMHLSNPEIERLRIVVSNHMRPLWLANDGLLPSRKAIYRFFRDTGEAGVDICLISLADVWGTYGAALPQTVWQQHLEVVRALLSAWWENPDESVSPPTLIDGNELMAELSIKPGPLVGRLLEEIREAQATGMVVNRGQALNLARSLLPPSGE
jgi:tRNA nucleotidyltransferase/poly(A) polymerase